MTTVAVYVRVSSEKQADDDRTSLSDQQRHCEGFADKQGWHASTVHSDTFSGYDSLDARVGLRRALDTITQGAVLLVWRFDRLSRDMVDMALIAREVHRKGARIVSVSEGELTNSPMGRLLGSLHTFAAESEREGITARTHGALRTRAEQGKLLVGPSNKYGYSYDGARKEWYVANPETAPVVQRMYALAEQGYTLYDIAKTLNDEGILTRSGYLRSKGLPSGNKGTATVWTRQSVYEVLTDRTYCGRHAAYNKQQVKVGNHKVMRPRPEDDGKRIAQPNVPALVSAETWDTVRAKLQSHMLGQVRTDEYRIAPLLTRGFGICGHCGARVTITKHDKGWYRYHCPNGGNRAVDPAKKCPGGSWAARVSLVDADIWGKVEEMAGDLARFKRMVQAPVQTAEDRVKAVERRQELLQAELAAAYREKDNLARRYGAEDDEDLAAVIHGRLKEVLATIAELEKRTSKAVFDIDRITAYLKTVDGACRKFAQFGAETFTREDRRTILKALNVRVRMYASASDYAQTHNGERWVLQLVPVGENSTPPGTFSLGGAMEGLRDHSENLHGPTASPRPHLP